MSGKFPDYQSIFEAAWGELSSCGEQVSRMGNGLNSKILTHGTTCVGLVNREGVVVGADGQATATNFRIETSTFEKLVSLDRFSLLAIAGSPGLAIKAARILKAQFTFDADHNEGEYIPPKSRAQVLASLVQRNLGMALGHGMVFAPLLAVYDTDPREPGGRLFSVWIDGAIDSAAFAGIGSGGPVATDTIEIILQENKKQPKELSLEEAKQIVVRALLNAHGHDAATGDYFFVKTVTARGVESVSGQEIKTMKEKAKKGETV